MLNTSGVAITGHDPAFCNPLIDIQYALQGVVKWKIDGEIERAVRHEMYEPFWLPTKE